MHPFIVRNLTFPLGQFYFGRRKWRREFRALWELQFLPAGELEKRQLELLRILLHYARSTIPYYRDLMGRNQIEPDDIKSIEQLWEFPLLNKEIINKHLDDLYNPNFPTKSYKNTSSGSTGHPVSFYDDGIKAGLGVAEEGRIKRNFGLPLGLPEARFVRLTEETISQDSTFRKRARLINQLIVPGMNLSEEVFERTREKVFTFKPRIIFGISSALYEFTLFLRDQGMKKSPWQVDLVICWAAPVFDHYVELLSGFYGCQVVNLYSTREVGHLASSCPQGKLHLHEENRIIEVIRNGTAAKPGESGRIVVTTLKPYAMPMLRYDTQDVGTISTAPCPCGRQLKHLERLDGRSGEILYLANGKIISPNYCCRLLMSPEFIGVIKQFQILQTAPSALEVRIVKTPSFKDQHLSTIYNVLEKSLGHGTSIKISCVPEISPMPSGKFQVSRRLIQAETGNVQYTTE